MLGCFRNKFLSVICCGAVLINIPNVFASPDYDESIKSKQASAGTRPFSLLQALKKHPEGAKKAKEGAVVPPPPPPLPPLAAKPTSTARKQKVVVSRRSSPAPIHKKSSQPRSLIKKEQVAPKVQSLSKPILLIKPPSSPKPKQLIGAPHSNKRVRLVGSELQNESQNITHPPAKLENVITRFEPTVNGSVITFLWSSPTRMAAFVRGNKLWMVFDKGAKLDFRDFSQQFSSQQNKKLKVYNLEQQQISNEATFAVADLNFTADDNIQISAARYRNSWVVEVSKNHDKYRDVPVQVNAMARPTPSVDLLAEEPMNKLIRYTDPVVGDSMVVVPFAADSKRVDRNYKFVDFNLLKTVQGIAIQQIVDNLSVIAFQNKVSITSAQGLSVSSVLRDYNIKAIDDLESHGHASDLLNFNTLPQAHFTEAYRQLNEQLAVSKASAKSVTRIKIVLLHLANEFYREARAYLELAKDESALIRKSYRVALIEAVIEYMNRNYEKAFAVIQQIDLQDVPFAHREEVRFWQSIIGYRVFELYKYLGLSNTVALYSGFKNNFLASYPYAIFVRVGFDILKDKVRNRSIEMAEKVIAVLKGLTLRDADRNRLYADMGQLYTIKRQLPLAVENFDLCIADVTDTLHYVKCNWWKAKLLHKNGMISIDDFTERLERVLIIWRSGSGSGIEMQILKDLYEVYKQQNQLLQALRIGQVVLDYYPNTIESLRVINDMSQLFINFFLTKNQAKIMPLQALELFYEFKHLLPIGYLGDEIILRVADCLMELDLLNKAADLLEHQVRNRLDGLKKERAINRLMHIYIDNEKPEQALKVLAVGADYTKLPEVIGNERKYLHAEALYKSGNSPEAVSLLRGDFSDKADEIKKTIFWAEKNWREFNDYSEPFLYRLDQAQDTPLSGDDVVRILKQAISYIMLEQFDLMQDMYEAFKSRLPAGNKYTKAIILLAEMSERDQQGVRVLAKNISAIKNTAESFISLVSEGS